MVYKKSFSIIEIIFVIILIGIISSQAVLHNNLSEIKLAKQQIILHLKYTRYIAMLDNKYDNENDLWFRKRWTMKFLNCESSIGGLYYVIYSDENLNGHISKEETLKDPLSDNYIYSYQCKEDSLYDKNKLILLTQRYDIDKIDISCNNTTTIGQISFDINGEAHSKLSTNENEFDKYKLNSKCTIDIFDTSGKKETVIIHENTGLID